MRLEAREGRTWLCGVCGRVSVDRGAMYAKGCGTWAVEVVTSSIVRRADGSIESATAYASDGAPAGVDSDDLRIEGL